jgi:hypothetical protein
LSHPLADRTGSSIEFRDLTVKSVVCVFGTTRHTEDASEHESVSRTNQHHDQSHREATEATALQGDRPIRHRA